MVSKIRMSRVVVVVIIALLALLVTQAFQTAQLYDRKHTEFKSRLSTSLERIAIHHEKAEDLRRYMHIVNRDFSTQYKDVLKQEFQHLMSSEQSISIQDTSIFDNGEVKKYLIIRGKAFDTITGLSTEQKVLAKDVRQLKDLFNNERKTIGSGDSSQISIQLDQRVTQQIFKKAKFINEMMIEAFRNNVYQDPDARIDVVFLDSVIRDELANDDLPKDYRFMITNEEGLPVNFKITSKNYNANLDTTKTQRASLFPGNILDENLQLHLFFPKKSGFIFKEMWGSLFASLTLVILIIVALIFQFKTILAQSRLSEMKNDFISNMTHEFKTPISTISLACEAMNDKDMVGEQSNQIAPFVKMIHDENKRLGVLVERILQSAVIDRGELKLKKETFSIHPIINEVVENARFRIHQTGGSILVELPQSSIELYTDKVHFTNIFQNLVDNAVKYSKEVPKITISLREENKKLVLSVKDEGIGIKKEHLNRIFDKLYRVPTGNVHNVKGFGLGLSYVKAITELNNWEIKVKSKPGEGSEFIITINEYKIC
jgi:two-component system phosphate regulon sensor histidine kinase PhoR